MYVNGYAQVTGYTPNAATGKGYVTCGLDKPYKAFLGVLA